MKYNNIDEAIEAKVNGQIGTEEFWCLVDAFNNAIELNDDDYVGQVLEDWARDEESRERYEND